MRGGKRANEVSTNRVKGALKSADRVKGEEEVVGSHLKEQTKRGWKVPKGQLSGVKKVKIPKGGRSTQG
jgi:hypothetical protein